MAPVEAAKNSPLLVIGPVRCALARAISLTHAQITHSDSAQTSELGSGFTPARLVALSIYYLSRAGSWELGCPGYLDLQYIPGLLSLRAPYYYPRRVQLRKETPQREAPSLVPHASFGCSFTLRIHGELSCRYDTRAGSFHRA